MTVDSGLAISSVPDRRAADDDQFGRLHQHEQLAVLHQVAADDGTDDDNNSDNCKHVNVLGACPRLFTLIGAG